MDDLNLAEDIMKQALRAGAEAAEVFIRSGRGTSVEAKDGEVEALEASHGAEIALRVLKNNRLGFSYVTGANGIEGIVRRAVECLEWSDEDAYNTIPASAVPADIPLYDSIIGSLKEEWLISGALSLEKNALQYDEKIKKVRKAEVSFSLSDTLIINSAGINHSYKKSAVSAQVTAFAQDEKGESQIASDFTVCRRLSDINLGSVAVNAAQRAIELIGPRKIAAEKLPVILPPDIAVEFLEVLSASFSADAVQKKRSFFAGKEGRAVASKVIHIEDDALMPWGNGSFPLDDEGVAAQRKVLVSGGTLLGFLHNSYTAKKAGTASTGNAVRGSAKGLPGIGITNLFIRPAEGGKDKSSFVSSLDKGILVTSVMGAHTANPVSGDFSIGISGLMIEGGSVSYPFSEAVISGNLLEMFKNVVETGSDLKFYGRAGSPSLLIGEMDISA
ncbi:MAG: TldD/PmbA family protein [Nitrospirae bacterium]|nr:TldD/PmbA family protein [Nitrospirota bacterium]